MHRLPRVLLVPVLALLLTAACGGGGDDAQTVGAGSTTAEDGAPTAETTTTTAPAVTGVTPTTTPAEAAPEPPPPATVVAEPAVPAEPQAEQPAQAPAPTTGRVDGTYTASDPSAQTEVVLRVAGGDPVASVQGTGDLPFAFDGVAPGRYVVEASERGPEVADPNGAVTSSATTVRSAPFDLQAGYTWTFDCDTNGCD